MVALFIGSHISDNKDHVTNLGPIWGRQDPGGPHVGHMSFAIWDAPLGLIIML